MEEQKHETLLARIKRREAEFDNRLNELNEEIEVLKREVFKGKYKKERFEAETTDEEIETSTEEVPSAQEKQGSLVENIKRQEAKFNDQMKRLNEEIEVLQKKVFKRKDKKVVESEEVSTEVVEPPTRKETFLDEIERYAGEADEKLKKMREEVEEIVQKVFRKKRK
ncbi:hypothetical protein [Priestia taiwanensis]|uniref:Uncharacterized protein n=2 Tax=Priestia taiwanensis TaxID=1347902 RepID=A0A917AYH9_9BACI|nr:hypothetical protein [Priestia taiwanensis]MBM7364431.1 chromosome segregation ATPase [Priestia taiwanensis]GGE81514.1 hypothetical protein GCM10007140_33880 [Priestia taiwanensis]